MTSTPNTPNTPIVRCDMAVSVDGFTAGLDAKKPPFLDAPFHRVTSWVFDGAEASQLMHAERTEGTGAYVMGRRMYDAAGEHWSVEAPYHKDVFVVTNRPHETVELKDGTTFRFVTDGVPAAIEAAKAACAPGKRVHLSGGATVVQQALAADLIDELHLHITPVLLGQGIRLFDGQPARITELEPLRVIDASGVTHISYRINRSQEG